MAELLFIATVVFVAYVVFVVLGDNKGSSEPVKTETVKPESPHDIQAETPVVLEKTEIKQAENIELPKKSPSKPSRAKTSSSKTSSTTKATAAPPPSASTPMADSLKNPKTGEVVKIPNSYNFAKRWIKDALVEEGLLDKVYKNNELNEAINAKIQTALQQLKTMDKYQ